MKKRIFYKNCRGFLPEEAEKFPFFHVTFWDKLLRGFICLSFSFAYPKEPELKESFPEGSILHISEGEGDKSTFLVIFNEDLQDEVEEIK